MTKRAQRTPRAYTSETDPRHELIAPLLRKGYTGIRLTWFPPLSRPVSGYVLECDQIEWRHLGPALVVAKRVIKHLPDIKKQEARA